MKVLIYDLCDKNIKAHLVIMNPKRRPIPEFITLDRLGNSTLIHIRQSNRAKRISIKIYHDKVELIIPYSILKSDSTFKKAQDFLLEKESWIRRKLEARQKYITYNPNGIVIFGVDYSLQYINSADQKVRLCNDSIIVYSISNNKAKLLKQFLADFLLSKVKKMISSINSKKNFKFTGIRISYNKSLWGGCSKKRVLYFNWLLVFVPLETLYYVIVHEMCHLLEMNHSPKFWNLVSTLCPDYRIHKSWLGENTYSLYDYSDHLGLTK